LAKKITIIRHAKSDWGNASSRDFDRPLNKRGLRDAPEMAQLFSNRVKDADTIISSPAMRAKTTALAFASKLGKTESDIVFNPDIYHAHHDTLFKVINRLEDTTQHVLIFGHNPGLSDLATLLTGDEFNLPTCAIVELKIEVEKWEEVSSCTATLLNYDFPKKHAHLQ